MEHDSMRLVMTTLADEAAARGLARALVEDRLVACAQLMPGPIRSTYRWEGELEEAGEWLLLLKLPAGGEERLLAELPARHPYDEPEVLVLPAGASPGYLAWARAQVGEGTA